MIGRADIEGSKSDVAMNAWPPQASYPCGNFSDTYCLKLATSKRIEKPRFHGLYSYWKCRSSQHLSFCSMRGFCPRWADLRTPALFFDRCTAPVKLPAWYCTRWGFFRWKPRPHTPLRTYTLKAQHTQPPPESDDQCMPHLPWTRKFHTRNKATASCEMMTLFHFTV